MFCFQIFSPYHVYDAVLTLKITGCEHGKKPGSLAHAFVKSCVITVVVVTHRTSSPSLSLPPALLPHDPAEEEGAGPRRGLQQSGVSPSSASRHIH